MLKELESRRVGDIATIYIKDGIQYCVYLPNAEVDLEKAKIMVAEKKAMCAEMDYPCLVDGRFLKSITPEARSYYTNSEEGNANIVAVAILVGSSISRIMGNLYLTLNTPKMPSRLFTDKALAIAWLAKYKFRS